MVKEKKEKQQKIKPTYDFDEKELSVAGFIPYTGKSLGKRGFFKMFGALVFGGLVVGAITVGGISFYRTQVLYPAKMKVVEENTGRYALSLYQDALNSYDTEALESITGGSKYLSSEVRLQNGVSAKEEFIKVALGTIKYTPLVSNTLNKYGSDYFKFGSNPFKVETSSSLVTEGEEVEVTYLDYSSLEFSEEEVKALMSEMGIDQNDSNIAVKLGEVFAQYIVNNKDSLPTTTEKRVVPMVGTAETGFSVTGEEDIYLDNLLFASEDFHDALVRFSEMALAGTLEDSKEYTEYQAKSEEEKAKIKEVPYQFDTRRFAKSDWVGFYALLSNESAESGTEVTPDTYIFPSGDGTKENPAGINTPVMTKALIEKEDGTLEEHNIKVTLLKVSYGSDAIKDIMRANIRNRGLDPKSNTKYIYTEWRVENMDGSSYTFDVNSALADAEGNVSGRTGVMYGLADRVNFEPYSFTEMQDWYSSTELPVKYLVWGRNFEKRVPLIWFKALSLSDGGEFTIPDDPVQTDDVSANTNNSSSSEDSE